MVRVALVMACPLLRPGLPLADTPYQIIFCLVVVAGAVADLTLVWDISDTLNGLMSIPNLIALLLLSPVVIKLTREHFAGLRK